MLPLEVVVRLNTISVQTFLHFVHGWEVCWVQCGVGGAATTSARRVVYYGGWNDRAWFSVVLLLLLLLLLLLFLFFLFFEFFSDLPLHLVKEIIL